MSEAIGQSVVLFANDVAPARFALKLRMNAPLITVGFAVLVLCTWAYSVVNRPLDDARPSSAMRT